MVQDYLTIQAISVAAEQAFLAGKFFFIFSIAGNTITKTYNFSQN
jgi:hypothetical protein